MEKLLLGLIRGVDHIARGLGLEDEHALPGQDHRAAAVLAVDQHGVVGGHAADDLLPGDAALLAILLARAHI